METLAKFSTVIGAILGLSGLFFGVFQYRKAQKFKRLQNLSLILGRFMNNETILSLFTKIDNYSENLHDEILKQELCDFNITIKYQLLGLIEEVALYAELSEVDYNYAIYLFQWPFYFLFEFEPTRNVFWANIGGEKEYTNVKSWGKSIKMAKACRAYIES